MEIQDAITADQVPDPFGGKFRRGKPKTPETLPTDYKRMIASAEERGFKGIWIPAEIWLRTDLTIREKTLRAEIESLDKGQGCRAGNEYLAWLIGVNTRSVQKMLVKLKSLGLVEDAGFDGRRRYLRATPGQLPKASTKRCHGRHGRGVTEDISTLSPVTPRENTESKGSTREDGPQDSLVRHRRRRLKCWNM